MKVTSENNVSLGSRHCASVGIAAAYLASNIYSWREHLENPCYVMKQSRCNCALVGIAASCFADNISQALRSCELSTY
jgi:hypothetical protein